MKTWLAALALVLFTPLVYANQQNLTVYQDPNCGCCDGWVDHMRAAGFHIKAIKTNNMASIKQKLGVPVNLSSCHTAIIEDSGQLVEGHVPANVVHKLIDQPNVKGVSAPGMPLNAPGMGDLDGNLITVDFNGKPFSRD